MIKRLQKTPVKGRPWEKAEAECLQDADARAKQRKRAAIRRQRLDIEYVNDFTDAIQRIYPKCPAKTASAIAEHACLKYSGRSLVISKKNGNFVLFRASSSEGYALRLN